MRLSYAILALAIMSTPSFASEFPYGDWAVVEVSSSPATIEQTMTFLEDGSVSGEGGCNSFGGMYEAKGHALALMNVFSTQMACPDLDAEGAFFAAMTSVAAWAAEDGSLLLLDAAGETAIKLTPSSLD